MSGLSTSYSIPGFLLACLLLAAGLRVCEAQAKSMSEKGIVHQAEQLVRQNEQVKAVEVLKLYLTAHPAAPEVSTLLAQIEMKQGNASDAELVLRQALAANGKSLAILDALGDLLLGEKRYAEAMDQFEAVISMDRRDAHARAGERDAATELALQARAGGHADAALEILQHARTVVPDDATLLTYIGIQAQQMHLLPVAAEALTRALAIEPRRPDALYGLARVETDVDRLSQAEGHLRAYLEQRPDDASAHFGLAHVLERQQKTEAAAKEFERSIELQPTQTESYFQLGQMALDIHHDDDAAKLFEKVLARDPKHGGALSGAGILAYRAKDYATARERLSAAIEASPEYQPAHYYLGLTLARLGDKASSDEQLQIATELARKQQGKGQPVSGASVR